MNYHQQFHRAAIERGIPEDEVGKFAEFLRFAIWTSGCPNGVPVGRRGGLPRLPVGMEWPSSENGPLPFIASLDCAALPRVDGLALPADGSLLLFLHHEWADESCSIAKEQEFARIVYVPAGTDTATAEEPDHDEDMFCDVRLDFVGREYDLFATVNAELPRWFDDEASRSDGQEHLARNLAHRKELCALVGELWPEDNIADIYLGGYSVDTCGLVTENMYDTPETGMAEDILEAREKAGELVVPPDERQLRLEEEALRLMREWVPLAQFDPGDEVYIARFLIRHDDLAAGRFDKALSFTAFTE
ncbi:hypothetical protein LP52_05470 [Streptomonospora alba]|uniref:DUF1963 domain-containing protein n=1 Tax=Streptomonospora alba TaxID=183763 RepID=A0A0C2FK14_9ACTN|nr:DUF1963 domain-containing protein [Streptomonospora alba]KIH99694.1 hypothetical protein LP52_05470 [Streptomonospora alba]